MTSSSQTFVPPLAEVPSKELEALKKRTVRSGFDFIDFGQWTLTIRTDNLLSTTGRLT